MVQIDVAYEGELHTRVVHGPSGATLATDAPTDNGGKGEAFSPTDLVGAALGSCMATIMGIYAGRHGIDLRGMAVSVRKTMATQPIRRIAGLEVTIRVPVPADHPHRAGLERAALTCPVHQSLHPDIALPVRFEYADAGHPAEKTFLATATA